MVHRKNDTAGKGSIKIITITGQLKQTVKIE